jgi:hypothetical protein
VSTDESFAPVEARYVRLTVLRTQARDQSVVLDEIEVWKAAPTPCNVALATAGAKVTARSTRTADGDATYYSADHLIDGKFDTHWISGEKGGQCTIELPRVETISRVVWSNDRTRSFERPFSTEYEIEVSLDGQAWTKVADHSGRRPADPRRLEELLLLNALPHDDRARHIQLSAERDELQTKLDRITPLPTAWAGRFKQPREATCLMIGGDVTKPGSTVAPASLGVLSKAAPRYELDADADEASRRLALADWLVSADNPLASRVLANRIWHYHFGRGIVATPSDFGFQGARPSHPELLDWLARQTIENGWRTKPIHRLVMTSMTYRQSGRYDPELAAIDADAVYLWRFPPKRLEAEAIRDSILSAAGALDLKIGGPGFRLYHYWIDNVATYVPLDRLGPETYRRAVYHQNPRSVKVDLLGEYDLPDCSLPTPKRETTTSPLQALALQNHSFMLDMAKAFAARLQREAGEEIDAQVARAFELAFGRLPNVDEASAAEMLVREHGLTLFCHAVLNANEFIYVD